MKNYEHYQHWHFGKSEALINSLITIAPDFIALFHCRNTSFDFNVYTVHVILFLDYATLDMGIGLNCILSRCNILAQLYFIGKPRIHVYHDFTLNISVFKALCYFFQDREQPYITESNLSSSNVEAYFAEDLPEFQLIRQFSGVDGFLLKTDALYKVNSGHQWYLLGWTTLTESCFRLQLQR